MIQVISKWALPLTRGRLIIAALLILAVIPARALTIDDQKVVDRGLDALYRGDYDGSEKIFESAINERPGDPAMSMGYAVATWWRMENDFALPGSPEEKRFLDAVKRAIDDAERATANHDDAEAYVCLGGAYGLRGRLEATRKHWLKAYLDGRKAYRNEQRALKIDSGFYDAYLGIGAFDYYTTTLSRFVRLFVFTKVVDKAQGLSELQVATHGHFAGVAAKLLLVGIDWTFEKNPRQAWAILAEIHDRYPDSPLIDSMRLVGLFHLRDAEGLKREAGRFLKKAQNGAPFYQPIDKAAGYYFLGLGEQLAGEYKQALGHYQIALELIPQGHRTRGLPRLFIGECLDLLGRREEAVVSYRQALSEQAFWGVPRYAKYLIKHPFNANDNPLPSRRDDLD